MAPSSSGQNPHHGPQGPEQSVLFLPCLVLPLSLSPLPHSAPAPRVCSLLLQHLEPASSLSSLDAGCSLCLECPSTSFKSLLKCHGFQSPSLMAPTRGQKYKRLTTTYPLATLPASDTFLHGLHVLSFFPPERQAGIFTCFCSLLCHQHLQ